VIPCCVPVLLFNVHYNYITNFSAQNYFHTRCSVRLNTPLLTSHPARLCKGLSKENKNHSSLCRIKEYNTEYNVMPTKEDGSAFKLSRAGGKCSSHFISGVHPTSRTTHCCCMRNFPLYNANGNFIQKSTSNEYVK
jgi:hypothetical protein